VEGSIAFLSFVVESFISIFVDTAGKCTPRQSTRNE
jgi:hypothetical protein